MRSMFRTIVGGLALIACVSGAAADEVVFSEDFNYTNNAQLRSAWTKVTGQELSLTTTDDDVDHEPYATLGNGIARRDLAATIKDQDWTLSFKILHTANARGGWVGLLNSEGTKGYGLLWDSGNNPHPAHGTVLISKFDLETEPTAWNVYGTPLKIGRSDRAGSGHPIFGPQFAEMKLHWEAKTGTLTASVNGTEVLVRSDPDFKEFSRIYVRGNTYVKFDDITVTVGAPAAAP